MATHRSSNLFLTLLSDCRVVPAVERAEFAKLACEEAAGVLMSGLWKPDTKTKFEISKFNMAIVDSRQRDDSTQYAHAYDHTVPTRTDDKCACKTFIGSACP
jgi:hypothetical protein